MFAIRFQESVASFWEKGQGGGEMEAFVTLASFLCDNVIQGHMTTSGKWKWGRGGIRFGLWWVLELGRSVCGEFSPQVEVPLSAWSPNDPDKYCRYYVWL